jgi:UDP-glucose 4-epimerase
LKIAITGANGFLGSHLIKSAQKDQHEVIAWIRKGADCQLLASVEVVRAVINYDTVKTLTDSIASSMAGQQPYDCIIHNAGLTVSLSSQAYFDANYGLIQKLIDALKQRNILSDGGKLVLISSYAANGPDGFTAPVSHYGESKKAAEVAVIESGFDYLICRPTGIYGPGDLAFLPLFQAASKGLFPILSPKDQQVTLIHAEDLANAIFTQIPEKNKTLHFSDGLVYNHQDLKKVLSLAVNRKLLTVQFPGFLAKVWLSFSDRVHALIERTPRVTLDKYNEISKNWDLQKNRQLLHPKTKIKFGLQEGFKDTFDYYKKHNLL